MFYGWWIVLGGGVMQGYASAVFWRGFQAFVDPILNTFTGWSYAWFAAAISIQRGESGLISPFVGVMLDRYGPKRVMIFGVAVTGAGFIVMSYMQTLWHFYFAVLLLALGMSFGTFIVFVATVGNWFIRQRARALSMLMTFSAVGAVALPLLVWSIDSFGWRSTLFAIGLGFWLIGFPIALMMRRRPEDYGLLPDGGVLQGVDSDGPRARQPRELSIGVRDVLRLRVFWQLAIATSLGQLVSSTNLFHLPALTEYGIDLWLASAAAGAVAIGDILGRVSIGIFGDKFDKKLLLALAFAIQMMGVGALSMINSDSLGISWGLLPLPIFVVGFGLGFGASIPLRLAILGDYFGRGSYGSIVGIASSVSAIFGTTGPLFVGFMHDFTSSYRPGYAIMAAALIVALPLTMTLESKSRVNAKARQLARARAAKFRSRRYSLENTVDR